MFRMVHGDHSYATGAARYMRSDSQISFFWKVHPLSATVTLL
jgi:hypothetical protein